MHVLLQPRRRCSTSRGLVCIPTRSSRGSEMPVSSLMPEIAMPASCSNEKPPVLTWNNALAPAGRVKRCSSKQVDIVSLGALRLDDGWHNAGYIFPDGFTTATVFRSSVRACTRHMASTLQVPHPALSSVQAALPTT